MKAKALIIFGALLFSSFVQGAQAQTVALRYGQIPSTIRTVSALQFYIAQRKGFFIREGIDFQMIPIEGGTDKMITALDRGAVDIARTATPYLIQAALKGSDTVAIAGETANPIYSLMVKPEIKTFADLKGRLLGLSLPIDTISISTRKLLTLHGLKESDFRVKELVGTPARFECLKKGDCDGVPLGQPDDFVALKLGYRRLGVSTDAVANFQFTVSAVRRPWAAANKDVVVGYIRALASAYPYMRDPSNRDEVARVVVETTGSSDDIARQTLGLYFEPERGVFPKQGELDLKGLGKVIEFMGEARELKAPLPPPECFVDLQYLGMAGIQ